jgi:hypothetical protein
MVFIYSKKNTKEEIMLYDPLPENQSDMSAEFRSPI